MDLIFSENRILGAYSPEQAVLAGRSAAICSKRIAVGCEGTKKSAALALISGIISMGGEAVVLGECLETELFLASEVSSCGLCLYIKDDPLMKINIRSQGGMVITGHQKQAIENSLKSNCYNEKEHIEGDIVDGKAFKTIYRNKINSIFPENCPYSVSVGNLNEKIFFNNNIGNKNEGLIITLSSDGTKASAFSEKSGFISMEELIFICCLELLEIGLDISVPFGFPYSANKFAESYGCRCFRYYMNPDGETDSIAREIALKQRFTLDGLYLAVKALAYITKKETNFVEIRSKIPKFYTTKKFIDLEQEKTNRIFGKYNEKTTPDGTTFAKNESRIVMQPSSSGKGIWLCAESHSMEIASELCANIEDKLKNNTF